jgi:atypical dual specificity phosphatase
MTGSGRPRAAPLPEPNHGALSSYHGPNGFCWLVRGWIAGTARPGIASDLAEDLALLRRLGIDVLVTLTEEWLPPVEAIATAGMESRYLAIADMGVPSAEQAMQHCALVAKDIAAGKRVVYHCRAGRGRTGTMLVAQLIWHGASYEQAITHAKRRNQLWVESDEQFLFLQEFAASLAA